MPIRAMTPDDIPQVARVHACTWKSAYREVLAPGAMEELHEGTFASIWDELIRDRSRTNLVCPVEGRIVGFAAFGPSRDEDVDAQRVGELYGIYVDPEHWGSGFGRALMRRVLELARPDYAELKAWVLEQNLRARRFYGSHGFLLEPDKVKTLAPFGSTLPELRYARPVELALDRSLLGIESG